MAVVPASEWHRSETRHQRWLSVPLPHLVGSTPRSHYWQPLPIRPRRQVPTANQVHRVRRIRLGSPRPHLPWPFLAHAAIGLARALRHALPPRSRFCFALLERLQPIRSMPGCLLRWHLHRRPPLMGRPLQVQRRVRGHHQRPLLGAVRNGEPMRRCQFRIAMQESWFRPPVGRAVPTRCNRGKPRARHLLRG